MSNLTTGLRNTLAALVLLTACSQTPNSGITPETHRWFPIASGSHAIGRTLAQGTMGCDSCHYHQSNSFTDFTCTGCHEHDDESLTDRLHFGVGRYAYTTTSCFSCHTTGEKGPFDHAGISGDCAACHQAGAPFAALPVAGFTHSTTPFDCGACHSTGNWSKAVPAGSYNPARNVTVIAQIPSYAGTSVVKLTEQVVSLRMLMDHGAPQIPADTLSNCSACHPNAAGQGYFPGVLHESLAAQPAACSSCHSAAAPAGFVGPAPLSPRNPTSPEMKHDAIAWSAGSPTATPLVQQDCAVCHAAPTQANPTTWAAGADGTSPAKYHPALASAGQSQPTSCLDCHANSRPIAPLTSANAAFPSGLVYDHQQTAAAGDCGSCHSTGGATQWTSWANGRFHAAGSSNPSTCLPCHEGERPTSTASWKAPGYANTPFDYVGSQSFNHGDSQDCAACHAGPGTDGAWGGTQTWVGGFYDHAARNPSSCLPCHLSQRPTQAVESFDHKIGGTGECRGCHQATVSRNRYVDLTDWKDGQAYPSDSLVAAPGQFVRITTIALTRGANGLVTGMTSSSITLNNAIKHTSSALPAELNAGTKLDSSNDFGKCWHCHQNDSGIVTDFTHGVLHKAFDEFRATPGGSVSPLSPPTACLDCHDPMRPPGIVERSASALLAMDHSATFTSAATIDGAAVTSVAQIDCAVCHSGPGTDWADGQFHARIGSAMPADCVACHYPLMADAAQADVASNPATRYAMKHRSTRIATQACQTCHAQANGMAASNPSAVALWKPGVLHASLATQPTACNDCHLVTTPSNRTQSSEVYALSKGATSTNGGQWMSHSASSAVGKDCVVCHAADATKTAWSKSVSFHSAVPGVTTCNACHGGGSSPGNGDNMPSGLIDTATITTSSAAAANTHDQIAHSDVNVTGHECNFCHTQVGSSTAAGRTGKEWAQALFHRSFTAPNPLVTNGTTGRCSNCHMNVKPGASFAAFNHAPYTATSAQDCSACHAWPGTSTNKPNWLGATGAHATSGSSVASTLDCVTCHGQSGNATHRLTVAASSHYGGVSNGNRCVTCHISFAGFKGAVTNLLYPHANAAANSGGCATCHAFSSQLYTVLTNTPSLSYPVSAGGHTFSQTRNVTGSFGGDSFTIAHTASSMASCGSCHQYSTTTASTNVWAFKHKPKNPGISNSKRSSACKNCH